MKNLILSAVALTAMAVSPAMAAEHGKVLVVMSSAQTLALKDGGTYATGYYLNELATPLKAIVDAGYEPVFADPEGNQPAMDASSNVPLFFGKDDGKRAEALAFIDSFEGLKHPRTLASVVKQGTSGYVGIFIPGGHAPMVDLIKDPSLGKLLRDFHSHGRPTGIICHGPIALLAALPNAGRYDAALAAGDTTALPGIARGWVYQGYKVTIFSKAEEQQIEAPQLKGHVQYYTDDALASAGATVQNADAWHPNVVEDRELVTAQQPFSDHAFADAFVAKLQAASAGQGATTAHHHAK